MEEKITIEELQEKIDGWILEHGDYWPPLSMLMAIMEEVGELARELNYLEGIKPKKPTERKSNIAEELADLLFSVMCLANYYNIDLNKEMKKALEKYSKRDAKRFV